MQFPQRLQVKLRTELVFVLHLRGLELTRDSKVVWCVSSGWDIVECMKVQFGRTGNKNVPFEVVVGHVEVFQREQEIVKGLDGDFDQLVVVDN